MYDNKANILQINDILSKDGAVIYDNSYLENLNWKEIRDEIQKILTKEIFITQN